MKKVLVMAEKIAVRQNTVMNTEHQLLALSMIKDTLAFEVLVNFKASRPSAASRFACKQENTAENP